MNKAALHFMDRRLKERLVGATILVVLIVLVVPELLSGPKRVAVPAAPGDSVDSVRSVTVDLTTRRATPAMDPAVSSPANPAPSSAAPPSAAAGPDSDSTIAPPIAPEAAPRPTIATLKAQQSADVPLEKAPPGPNGGVVAPRTAARESGSAANASAHGWSVQIGSFANHANADKAMRHLKTLDPSAYVSPIGAGRSQRFRVRIGPFADRGEAEKALARVRKDGETASLVPP